MHTYQTATQCHNHCECAACSWRILKYGIRLKTQVFMAVNMKSVSFGMWHFSRINYLCYLGVRVPLKWRQWVSLRCGLFSIHILETHIIHEMCVCVCAHVNLRACAVNSCVKRKLCHFCMRLLRVPTWVCDALYSVCIVCCEVQVAYVTVIEWSTSVKIQMQCFMVEPRTRFVPV
jgi:hypothetical protein